MPELVYPPVIALAKTMFRVLDLRITVEGAHHVPRTGGAVMASNHVSYLDFTRGTPVLRYATNKSGSMVAETVTTSDDVLGETSIAVDSSGAPHISFPSPSSSFGNLGYAVKR